jgi:hypothetical protein
MPHAGNGWIRKRAMRTGKRGDLAKVKLGVFFVGNTLYLDERGVWAGVSLCTLVPEDAALGVESEIQGIGQWGSRGRLRLGRYIRPSGTASTAWDATEAVFVVFCEIRLNTDLVEPIFCLEEEKGPSLIVFLGRRDEDGGDVTMSQR